MDQKVYQTKQQLLLLLLFLFFKILNTHLLFQIFCMKTIFQTVYSNPIEIEIELVCNVTVFKKWNW